MRSQSCPLVPVLWLSLVLAPAAISQTPLKTVQVASGLTQALDVKAPRGDRERIFIVEQRGLIKILKKGTLLATPFLDLTSKVACCGERGLLGLAFHPDYASNGYFFVCYTINSPFGSSVVERYTVSTTNPDVADPNSRKAILGPISQPYSNHNGGHVAFGKDGFLYIGFGDGGSGGDPACNAQNGQSLLGKLLRIDINTNLAYVNPPSNPFVKNTSFKDEIWAYGLRNPWRFSFDRETGDLYIGDVGQGSVEEIDYQPATSTGGENYGWKIMEGSQCYGNSNCTAPPQCKAASLITPIHEYTHSTGRCITGGYVYRGCAIPDLRGTYFFADYTNRRIWSFRVQKGTKFAFQERTQELGWTGSVSSFGEDGCGEIYICSYSGSAGGSSVYKIVPNSPPPVVDLGYGKLGGNGKIPEFTACGLLDTGNSAEFRLFDSRAQALAILVLSSQSMPTKLFGGTLVPVPPQFLINFISDQNGTVSFQVPGGGGPTAIYAQYVVLDPKATQGIAFSNALRIDFQK